MPVPQEDIQHSLAAAEDTATFQRLVRARRSFRRFLSTPISKEKIREILEDAQFSPSNCNTQPWAVHVVSGDALVALSDRLVAAHESEDHSLDFTFSTDAFSGTYKRRQMDQGRAYYTALGVARDDAAGRAEAAAKNYHFFGAPHAAFLFMPEVGDNVRVASDVGMYAQTFLLALTAYGLGGIPQTMLGFFADTVRDELSIAPDMKLLFGISFGYPDLQARENATRLGRDSIDENVTFHE